MELEITKREVGKKGEIKRLRREKKVPAILYGPDSEPQGITVDLVQWEAALRQIPKGHLSTVIFDLKGEGGAHRALVKEVQYHPTTYAVRHLDFILVSDGRPVNVKIPLRFTGVEECEGIKQGGVLRPIIRAMRVQCLPGQIPTDLTIDVTDLGMKQSRRLSAIQLPEGVRPLVALREVAVVIAKR